MNLTIAHPDGHCKGALQITGSKSETNRLLLLQALFSGFEVENKSNADDSVVMEAALKTQESTIDVHHAGTAMRFLTAFFSHQQGREVILTGSQRMQERPIKILVEALRSLGASISYVNKEGYPPLKIEGKLLKGGYVTLPADVSSQYISALLMMGPTLEQGISLSLQGNITSVPYIEMTLALLNNFGVSTRFQGNTIEVDFQPHILRKTQVVESDWSSASYFFSIVALSQTASIQLNSYKKNSLQGDAILMEIYRSLGVESIIEGHTLFLTKKEHPLPERIRWDLTTAPDIAQTLAVSCFGLGVGCDLEGLHTLKIKETDRLEALYTELTKLGANISVTDKSLHLAPGGKLKPNCSIPTYNDHRMALAFAPLGLKTPLTIEEAEVVSKSYPDYWTDLKNLNFNIL